MGSIGELLMKLGRLAPDYNVDRLWVEDYYHTDSLPVPPVCVDRMSRVSTWPMYDNDKYGDCTVAAAAHLFGATSTYAKGVEATFNETQIVATYEGVCPGFDPVTDANDNGAVMSNVLAYLRSTGMGGHKATAYAQLRHTDIDSLKLALYLFGSVYIGVNLPASAEAQFAQGLPWTYQRGSRILGGHCVDIQKIDPRYPNPYSVITWGGAVRVAQTWMDTYLEEAWVVVTPDWLQSNLHTIDGLDITALEADMNAI